MKMTILFLRRGFASLMVWKASRAAARLYGHASALISSTTARQNQGANGSGGSHLHYFLEYYVVQLIVSAGIRLRPWSNAAMHAK